VTTCKTLCRGLGHQTLRILRCNELRGPRMNRSAKALSDQWIDEPQRSPSGHIAWDYFVDSSLCYRAYSPSGDGPASRPVYSDSHQPLTEYADRIVMAATIARTTKIFR
jgi:hypothetical protein